MHDIPYEKTNYLSDTFSKSPNLPMQILRTKLLPHFREGQPLSSRRHLMRIAYDRQGRWSGG